MTSPASATPVPHDDHASFDVLHALRVKGFASIPSLSTLQQRHETEVEATVEALRRHQLVAYREGRVSGWRLTPDGTASHDVLLAARRVDADHPLHDLHREFTPLNTNFKVLCTSWQMRGDAPNDHTDAAHDEAIVDGVTSLHDEIESVLDESGPFMRARWYVPRLRHALHRFVAGDHSALTRPLSESYHDVWMELHQDLILTLGLRRTHADA